VRLWKSLDEAQSLQRPAELGLEPYVIDCFQRMYSAFHRDRDKLEAASIIDVRYEDLVVNPVAQLEAIYAQLKLGDFDYVRDAIQEWSQTQHREYKTNQHRLPPEQEALIAESWSDYFIRYGY